MTTFTVGEVVLIRSKATIGRVAYVFWKSEKHGFCQMGEVSVDNLLGFKPKYIVVPNFDRCGEPCPIEVWEDDLVKHIGEKTD